LTISCAFLLFAGLFSSLSVQGAEAGFFTKKPKSTVVTPVSEKVVAKLQEEHIPVSFAVSPEIPDEVNFCGEVIDLRKADMRERFDREMMTMMYLHSSTLLLLKRANRYFPIIEPILKENNIPDDFKYLACIESGLNPRAISSAKAIGMWQFMSETAMQFGLEVNEEVDERYHVQKETAAACRYLRDAYNRYGDWSTAAASYNAGTYRISKELDRQGETKSFNLWLVEETARYVFRILACKEFMSHPQHYGYSIKKDQLYMPLICKDTVVTGKVSNWVTFAKEQGISFYDLKNNNSWIRSDSLVNVDGKAYPVAIPQKESLYFDKNKITIHQKNWVIDAE